MLPLVIGCKENRSESATTVRIDSASIPNSPLSREEPSYQQEWVPGQPDEGYYENQSRFLARSHYFSTGRLFLWLDTSLTRAPQKTPRTDFTAVDSVTVTGLGPHEFFTNYCRIGQGLADGQLGELARTLVPEKWERPRLAWAFDTMTSRIRSIPTDSVSCAVPDAD